MKWLLLFALVLTAVLVVLAWRASPGMIEPSPFPNVNGCLGLVCPTPLAN